MRTSIARLIAVFGLLIGALALGTAAAANNGNGASYTVQDLCSYLGGGERICFSEKGEVNVTQTPTGQYVFEQNAKGTDIHTFPHVTENETYSFHQQYSTVEDHFLSRDTVIINGGTYTFCITERFHATQGGVQFDSFDVTPGAC